MKYPLYEFILVDESEHFTTAIVKDPAVKQTLMYFEAEAPEFFANEEKRLIYSVAMVPNRKIFRKDINGSPAYGFFSAESIEKFQENYSKFNGTDKTNINHSDEHVTGVYPIENWIVKNPDMDKSKELGLKTEAGSLVMCFKVENDAVWEQCKNGDLDGLSIEAHLEKRLVSNFKTEIEMSKLEKVTAFFKELFADEIQETDEEKAKRLEAEAKAKEEEMAAEPAVPPAEPDNVEALENEIEMHKAKIAELEVKLATMEADEVKSSTELATMKAEKEAVVAEFTKFKSETPAKFVKDLPSNEKKSYEQMSNKEKVQFNRGLI